MAGDNREEFQSQMNRGYNAAWDQNWVEAIDAYSNASQLFPEDPEALIGLGLALLYQGQLVESLKVYERAAELAPDDPVPLESSADVLERMGRLKEAARQYVRVADIYLGQHDLNKAIGNWERATQLTPGLVSIHARLAQAYERIGDSRRAVREFLTLAFNFRRLGDVDKAIRAAERALRLDRRNSQVLNTLQALRTGGEVSLPDETRILPDHRRRADPSVLFAKPVVPLPDVGRSDPLGPMGEAMVAALSALSVDLIEAGELNAATGAALQALELQRQGFYEDAAAAYQKAMAAGLQHPALLFSLGCLLLMNGQPAAAVTHLESALDDARFLAGALHALGRAYFTLGDHPRSSRYLIRSLLAVDTALAIDPDEADELKGVYNTLLQALEKRAPHALMPINERFIGLLSGDDWKQRIADTRRHLDETLHDEGDQGLVDFLIARGSDELPESVSLIDRYINQGVYTLAMDECHRAIERSPYYLPVHFRMAEIMMKEGRIRQAIKKYNMVARSYMVREENHRAASILSEVLEKAPLNTEVRLNLIELLEGENRMEEALDQTIDLAGTYQQLGDFDRASVSYLEAQNLAEQVQAPVWRQITIKHHIADINQMRLNTRLAMRMYEEILELAPNDERALRGLLEMHYSQGNRVEAIRQLDVLLGVFARARKVDQIIQTLEEMVQLHAEDMALRSRLAAIFMRLGHHAQAIEQLDALGDLQLQSGLKTEAVNTIRQIIRMKPDQVEAYRRLLLQLEG